MKHMIDVHVHIDQINIIPGGKFDFLHPPEALIVTDEVVRQMDGEDVCKAVIMQHPNQPLNEAVSQAVRAHPQRFRGAMVIDLKDEKCLQEIEENFAKGLTVIKLEMFGTALMYPGIKLDSPLLQKVYAKAQELGIVITVDPHKPGMEGYQPQELNRVVKQYPGLQFVICHLGFPTADLMQDEKHKAQWEEMASLVQYDNVCFDVSAMPAMFRMVEDYPFPSAARLLKETIATYGADKVMWGSDILGELREATYRQLMDMFTESGLLTEEEKIAFFYDNANRVYFQD